MSAETRAALQEVARPAGVDDAALAAATERAASAVRAVADHWNYMAPAKAADAALDGLPGDRAALRRALVARLALSPASAPAHRLPASIVDLYPAAYARLAEWLRSGGEGDDPFVKDLRFALGLSVPCGARVVDLTRRIGPKTVLAHVKEKRDPTPAAAWTAARGWGNWYSTHIDVRDLAENTPEGWRACFLRVAEMLALNLDVRGAAGGGSWLYDPQLPAVTPKLAYLQEEPLAHGAFRLWSGTGGLHERNATARSETRRAAVAEGRYRPEGWLLAWPRAALLRWADARSGKLDRAA